MNAGDLIKLLSEVPADMEVEILTEDREGFLNNRKYAASAGVRSDTEKPSSFTIVIDYDPLFDKPCSE